jgi:hypothetical protein
MNLDLTGATTWQPGFRPTHQHRYAPGEVRQLVDLQGTEAVLHTPFGTAERLPYRRFTALFTRITNTTPTEA